MNRSLHFKWFRFQIIPICLNERGIFRPIRVTSVSEGPSLLKGLACKDRITITETFLNESSLMINSLFLRFFIQISWSRLIHRRIDRLIHERAFILRMALNEHRGMLRFSYLQEKMRMWFFSFTLFAEIEIWASAALISDTLNWSGIAPITWYTFMDLWCLISSSFP